MSVWMLWGLMVGVLTLVGIPAYLFAGDVSGGTPTRTVRRTCVAPRQPVNRYRGVYRITR